MDPQLLQNQMDDDIVPEADPQENMGVQQPAKNITN